MTRSIEALHQYLYQILEFGVVADPSILYSRAEMENVETSDGSSGLQLHPRASRHCEPRVLFRAVLHLRRFRCIGRILYHTRHSRSVGETEAETKPMAPSTATPSNLHRAPV
jgi:hypothetical protein